MVIIILPLVVLLYIFKFVKGGVWCCIFLSSKKLQQSEKDIMIGDVGLGWHLGKCH